VKSKQILGGLAALLFCLYGTATAQQSTPPAPREAAAAAPDAALRSGPATVAPHWSRNKSPDSIPEGAVFYIVVRGDTLWDISARFLKSPYLWPQVWQQNKYVTDAHWIYPGDPILLPQLAVVAPRAGVSEPGVGTTEEAEGQQGGAAGKAGATGAAGAAGATLVPVTEEDTLRCADYVVQDHEDESFKVVGAEEGPTRATMAERDIVYLNKGANAGVKPGDQFTIHRRPYDVKHPVTGKRVGSKIMTTGWLRVMLVRETASTAVIERACVETTAGDYLRPWEKVAVPFITPRPRADYLTPPTGKLSATVVDMTENVAVGAEGTLVTIDAGVQEGVQPGNAFVVYKISYPGLPSPRRVIGEIVVISVRDKTATAKVTYSMDAVTLGDRAELR
jgi:hypothetical protein